MTSINQDVRKEDIKAYIDKTHTLPHACAVAYAPHGLISGISTPSMIIEVPAY